MIVTDYPAALTDAWRLNRAYPARLLAVLDELDTLPPDEAAERYGDDSIDVHDYLVLGMECLVRAGVPIDDVTWLITGGSP